MDYAEAADHAESLFFAKNAIGKAVVSTRMQQRAERLEFDMRTGGDSTARLAIQAVTPLAAVRCIYLGQAFLVYQPEKWLDVMERSLLLFRQRFGDKSYKAIQHRYVYHWTVRKISVMDEISPQVYALRRRSFIDGLLMLAIQEGLLRIDINAKRPGRNRRKKVKGRRTALPLPNIKKTLAIGCALYYNSLVDKRKRLSSIALVGPALKA